MSVYYVKKESPHYFEIMGFTAVDAWNNIKPMRNLKLEKQITPTIKSKREDKIEMDEDKQDKCFKGLAGDTKKGLKPCTISKYCWQVNTAPRKSGYHLTHQLLYFLVGQVKG
jgi:hypothetical protein